MAEPTRLEIRPAAGLWVLTRDGDPVRDYGHVDRAVHEATAMAREMERTGQPATVSVQTAKGDMIEVEPDAEPPASQEPPGADKSALNPHR